MRVSVLGAGHVGLVTGVVFAHLGHDVTCTDVDADRLELLSAAKPPFHEPGVQDLLDEGLAAGRLRFTADPADALRDAEVAFICVGTPPRIDGTANLAAVEATARTVARHAEPGLVVVEKSTVPAGTGERIRPMLARERPGVPFEVVSNPEFLREGSAVHDSLEPERILVGADSERGFEVMRRLYEPILAKGVRLIETDVRTAELAKHASNAFLALKISYANALARICERAGADVVRVADVMGADSRIGRSFLDAGLGYGGSCFPKDIAAFERLAAGLGYDFPLLREVARLNDEALDAAVARVREVLWNVEGKRVALLGLAYKGGTDDLRFSPGLEVARRLLELGAEVAGYDPQAAEAAAHELPGLHVAADPYDAAIGAHCLVICTNWDEFRSLDLGRLHDAMASPTIVDGRNLLDAAAAQAAGIAYHPTGRPPLLPEPLAR